MLSSSPAEAMRFPFGENDNWAMRPVWNVHLDETVTFFSLTLIRMIRPEACGISTPALDENEHETYVTSSEQAAIRGERQSQDFTLVVFEFRFHLNLAARDCRKDHLLHPRTKSDSVRARSGEGCDSQGRSSMSG